MTPISREIEDILEEIGPLFHENHGLFAQKKDPFFPYFEDTFFISPLFHGKPRTFLKNYTPIFIHLGHVKFTPYLMGK